MDEKGGVDGVVVWERFLLVRERGLLTKVYV